MAVHANIGVAIEKYYGRYMLNSKDISEMFGGVSKSTVSKLKHEARVLMLQKGVPLWDNRHVDTKTAFEAWKLDINDLEKRYERLQKFKGGYQ